MSRRPVASNPVRRRGDVRRRKWSEAPIPKPATRRVRNLAAIQSWLVDTSGETTGEFWEFAEGVVPPGTDGYFIVYPIDTEATLALSYGVPPGDSVSIDMVDAGPYTAAVGWPTETVTNANDGMWLETFGYPMSAVRWVPA